MIKIVVRFLNRNLILRSSHFQINSFLPIFNVNSKLEGPLEN